MLSNDPTGPHGSISPRILLVDDDPNLLVVLSERLTADGFDVAPLEVDDPTGDWDGDAVVATDTRAASLRVLT